jgi:hypothetical protein
LDDKTIGEEWKTKEYYHPLTAEEVLDEQIHEQIFQEDLNDEDPDETYLSIILLDEDEVILPHLPPANEYGYMINISDMDDHVEYPSDVVDQHIDYFIYVGRHRWGVGCIIFMEILFTTLKLYLNKKSLSCLLHRTGIHAYMIQIFGTLMMIWLQICFVRSRMNFRSILMVIFNHPLGVLMRILLGIHIFSMKRFNQICPRI